MIERLLGFFTANLTSLILRENKELLENQVPMVNREKSDHRVLKANQEKRDQKVQRWA